VTAGVRMSGSVLPALYDFEQNLRLAVANALRPKQRAMQPKISLAEWVRAIKGPQERPAPALDTRVEELLARPSIIQQAGELQRPQLLP